VNRRELRAQMRIRRRAAAQAMAEARARARAAADRNPAIRRARRAKRLRRAVTAAVVLALLLLIHCECGPAAPPEPVVAVQQKAPPPVEKKKPPPAPPRPGKLSAKLEPQRRPAFVGQGVATPPWVDEFRLQVSARSPRLAKCFVGVDRPGALRWVSSVNPTSGAVSDHEFEPIGLGAELSPAQRECVTAVLSSPPYHLGETSPDALPNRVSLVIEF